MPFKAKRITRTHIIQLSASPSRVFPLFEPIGEKYWAAGWEPDMVYPESGVAEEGAVFTTQHPDEAKTIWVIVKYDPKRFQIEYARITPDSRVAKIDIRCEDNSAGTTQAYVSYTFTALTEQGNTYIDGFTEEHYQKWMASWETAINYYLHHGQTLLQH